MLSGVLYTITSIRERCGTQEVVDTKEWRKIVPAGPRPLRTPPPSINPQGTLRCIINNTVEFRVQDLLMLRSQRLKMYFTL